MAQTFGYGFFIKQIILKPFSWIATGLRLEDRPGSSSMFESEVEFAKSILVKASHSQTQIGLVLFDELFHSTNPPDGERTADIFLQRLWKKTNVVSVISTHVFSLVERSPSSIQRLSVPAFKDSSGNLHFTYTLGVGLCKESSVDMILKEKNLL
jgi:DNA mismatch repair ATPase MutS